MAEPTRYLLDARSIVRNFGPVQVLRGIDFAIAPGEIHALLGGNGAGKSTLLKIVSGQIPSSGGTLYYNGHEVDSTAAELAHARGIAVVHQETALLPHLTVAENIVLPAQARGLGLFRQRDADSKALAALSLLDRDFARRATHRLVGSLSLHEKQLVEISRALSSGAQLLLLDEPTANLTTEETERLFDVLRRLVRDSGISIVFVSHRMREIRQIADVCTIIRDGTTAVHRMPLSQLTDEEIIDKMGLASSVATEARTRKAAPSAAPAPANGEAGLAIDGCGITVTVGHGTILGLAGAPAGPTALIEMLVGAVPAPDLSVRVNGQVLRSRAPRDAVRQGVGFVSGDRANKGLLSTLPIIDNMLAARRVRNGQVRVAGDEVAVASSLLRALSIKAASLWNLPSTLSGGTQQKLLLARWLMLKPSLLVLEEPTRGVDIRTKREIYALIRQMAEAGTNIVWWSTEQVELLELCDMVLPFDPFGVPGQPIKVEELDEERLAAATGLAA